MGAATRRGGRQTSPNGVTVTTNNRERMLGSWNDLTETEREDFDYLTTETEREELRFVRFRDYIVDTSDTEGLAPDDLRTLGWDTYLSTSFFDGLVFRFFDKDGDLLDGVVVGHYTT